MVKGRNIDQALRFLLDVVQYVKDKKLKAFLISFDLKKAFDYVDPEFLFGALQAYNLPRDFIKWIRLLYTNLESCIIINGNISKNFNIS